MTYDDLLRKIDHNLKYASSWYEDNDYTEGKDNPFLKALRAVLELHKPWEGARMNGGGFNGPWCSHCEEVFDGSIRHPCPTVEAIQKVLS